MSKKHHGGPGPIPPGNRSHSGKPSKPGEEGEALEDIQKGGEVSPQQDDPKHRLGDYTSTGGHSIQEPGGKNGSDH